MDNKSFFKTKEGGLTIAFIVIIAAFFVILAGLKMSGDEVILAGFILIIVAMFYSPVKEFIGKHKT